MIEAALRAAQAETERPSLIACHTHIAFGSPNKQNSASAHGEPLGEEEVRLTKQALGCPPDAHFCIPDEALGVFRQALLHGAQAEEQWKRLLDAYRAAHPQEAQLLDTLWAGKLPEGWQQALPSFEPDPGGMATRQASGVVLNALAPVLPTLIGGSADLAPSNNTLLKGFPDFQAGQSTRFFDSLEGE